MHKAFVFGKFMPFHKGHEAMIDFALSKGDLLTVLICCSDQEAIRGDTRSKWLKETYAGRSDIEIRVFDYRESQLPNTSVTSEHVSRLWASTFKALLPDYSIVVTSEPYGDLVAAYMGIQHLAFDSNKLLYPISASRIRNDIFRHWQFLPTSVRADYSTKVVILGTESTGKTTLTGKLANHFNGSSVMEAGRDLIADSNAFEMGDLQKVAAEHALRIQAAARGGSPLVFIDTDIHITISYARFSLDSSLPITGYIYAQNKADLYLYLNNDVIYYQDGTRLAEEGRNLLDLSHRKILREFGIPFEEITGSWESRFEKCVVLVERLMHEKRLRHSAGAI
ncbi:MAG: AAA family ATPase [Chitinophagaceae bacterium]|nr:AAA family ATPase [Chitinophagaceae bacterium]